MIIYLLHNFNNYYNRIVKRFDRVADYTNAVGSENWAQRGTTAVTAGGYGPVNFNINDGITADITYNYTDAQDWEPDYVLACEENSQGLYVIKYRFFVLEAVRTRKYQYKLTLRRDLIADNYGAVLDAPMYIEKAIINDNNDPYLFQSEGMAYNQIKDEPEILLQDVSKSAWIVGYMAKPSTAINDIVGTVNVNADYVTSNIDTWMTANLPNSIVYNASDWEVKWAYKYLNTNTKISVSTSLSKDNSSISGDYISGSTSLKLVSTFNDDNNEVATNMRAILSNKPTALSTHFNSYLGTVNNFGVITESTAAQLLSKNNKIVYDSTAGKYYRITVSTNYFEAGHYHYNIVNSGDSQPLFSTINSWITPTYFTATGTGNNYSAQGSGYYIDNAEQVHTITATKTLMAEPAVEYKTSIPTTVKKVTDAPYCMFAIPLNGMVYALDNTAYDNNTTEINIAIANGIINALADNLYDIQLLPYCPKQANISYYYPTPTSDPVPYIKLISGVGHDVVNEDYTYIKTGNNNCGVILWCTEAKGTFNILKNISGGDTALDTKVINETEMWRLCSPNYNSAYEFNAAKNGGITAFNVDYEYKPYTPYIHLNPWFNKLYGADTNDARGLVCAGDFSLPNWTSRYQEYLVNNKNYQQMFDRQIESMDIMHGIDKEQRNWQSLAGVIGGAVGGAKIGAAGGGIGSAVGAVAGAAVGVVGASIDWKLQEARYSEQKSLAIDNFDMSVDNIKARPNVLTKVSAYNPNNKLFPFIEHYHATEAEVDALKDKLKYNGMSVNRIGKIMDYLQSDYSFIKGKLIRLENSNMEFHEQMELAKELQQGVFIK